MPDLTPASALGRWGPSTVLGWFSCPIGAVPDTAREELAMDLAGRRTFMLRVAPAREYPDADLPASVWLADDDDLHEFAHTPEFDLDVGLGVVKDLSLSVVDVASS